MSDRKGFVYLMNARGTNLYKIGKAKNPLIRRQQLNSRQSPYYIDLVGYVWMEDSFAWESALKQSYKFLEIKNEWYDFSGYPGGAIQKESFYNMLFMAPDDLTLGIITLIDFICDILDKPMSTAPNSFEKIADWLEESLCHQEAYAQVLGQRWLGYATPFHCDRLNTKFSFVLFTLEQYLSANYNQMNQVLEARVNEVMDERFAI